MVIIENNQVYSNSGKYVHRLNSNSYFKRGTTFKGDIEAYFEEVDFIPKAINIDYNEEVNSLIREKYSLSEELAILRQRDTKPEEFNEYHAYAEECKSRVKSLINK